MDVNAAPWLSQMRAALTRAGGSRGITMSISGHSADAIDSFTLVRSWFPSIILTTAGVVLLFVGIAFRSPFIPLRSVFTIALTLLFVCVAAHVAAASKDARVCLQVQRWGAVRTQVRIGGFDLRAQGVQRARVWWAQRRWRDSGGRMRGGGTPTVPHELPIHRRVCACVVYVCVCVCMLVCVCVRALVLCVCLCV